MAEGGEEPFEKPPWEETSFLQRDMASDRRKEGERDTTEEVLLRFLVVVFSSSSFLPLCRIIFLNEAVSSPICPSLLLCHFVVILRDSQDILSEKNQGSTNPLPPQKKRRPVCPPFGC